MIKPSFCFLGLLCLGSFVLPETFALSPTPVSKETSMDDAWNASAIIAYGRITNLQLLPSGKGGGKYLAVFQIERCWKGQLTGEVIIVEPLSDGGGNDQLLQFNHTYILQLSKNETGRTYTRNGAQELSLPIVKDAKANPRSSVFGYSPFLTWVEFLERKTGNAAEADRIKQLRGQDLIDREAGASKTKIISDIANAQFRIAMQETRAAERKTLLEALLKQVQYEAQEDMVALTAKVKSEISVTATLLSNGITTVP
jgi:hypothetical protein